MRFKPPARYYDGFFFGNGDGEGPVGSVLYQPRVVDSAGAYRNLDDLVGPGFALINLGGPPQLLEGLTAPIWERLGGARVDLAFDERLLVRGTRFCAVADADGLLAEQLAKLRGQIIFVRPDRFIAGAFAASDERQFAAEVERQLGSPGPAAEPVSVA